MSPCSSAVRDAGQPSLPYSISELIPQDGSMVLLDRVLEVEENHIVAELDVRDDGLFPGEQGQVPAWVGIEYMAQTIAAFSGYWRKCRGDAIQLGFLLGTRLYECSGGDFPCGTRLRVYAEMIMESADGMAIFDCRIEGEGIWAAAKLNALLPRDAESFLRGKGV